MTGRPFRTLFVTQWFDPEPGAIRGLPLAAWLQSRGHEVEVLTGFPNYPGGRVYPGYRIEPWARETLQGVPVLRVALYPSHDTSPARRVANYASFALSASVLGAALARQADVGFVYHPPPTVGLPGLTLRALRGIPFVYHIADMWPESAVESGMFGTGRLRDVAERAIHAWCDLVYRRAAAITVLSPGFKRMLIERGVPADKVHVVYNWCDEELFRPRPRSEALAAELGLAGTFNVIYAGNLGLFQALGTVVRAAALLRDLPDVRVVFVGTGQEEEALKAEAGALGLDNVRFVGRRDMREMPAINDLADVQLVHLKDLPFFASTVPSKTQVALAAGRPVVLGVRGDAADIIREAGAGLVCRPEDPVGMADAIRRLHGMSAPEREAMGAAGRAFYLERMSLAVGGAQMDALLRSVARGGRAR